MKNLKMLVAILLLTSISTAVNAQNKSTRTETFKVWGNCGMCEKTIENALKVNGVSSAEWNKETKMITVSFKPNKITLEEIHKKIAGVGYDTELETASNEVYNNLHGCCKYERKNK
jgi:mercuric ion binding protein